MLTPWSTTRCWVRLILGIRVTFNSSLKLCGLKISGLKIRGLSADVLFLTSVAAAFSLWISDNVGNRAL